jgi:hypothetical protein
MKNIPVFFNVSFDNLTIWISVKWWQLYYFRLIGHFAFKIVSIYVSVRNILKKQIFCIIYWSSFQLLKCLVLKKYFVFFRRTNTGTSYVSYKLTNHLKYITDNWVCHFVTALSIKEQKATIFMYFVRYREPLFFRTYDNWIRGFTDRSE